MIRIAHRGLTNGPNKQFENQPNTIRSSLAKGFDAEIDLWAVGNKLYLGHDEPQYQVTEDFIKIKGLWIHAKSLGAFHWLVNSNLNLNYFWHEKDSYALTSKGFIWAYPGKTLTSHCVMVMPESVDITLSNTIGVNCYAICSDYVEKIK
jgi:hypothetical protein